MVYFYIELLQGTPLLLQLFLVFFGLPLLGVDVSPLLAAGLALTLYAGAFLAEIWRGCVDAIPRGQWEASAALGLNFLSQMRDVILPQALRNVLPPMGTTTIYLIKDTALASAIGTPELLRIGQLIAVETFRPVETLTIVADRLLEETAFAVADRALLPDWNGRLPRNPRLLAAHRMEVEGEMPLWQPPLPRRPRRNLLGWLRGSPP